MKFPKFKLVSRGGATQGTFFYPEVRRCRCKIERIRYSTYPLVTYADIVYTRESPEGGPPVFRRFIVERYSSEYNVRAHVMREGDAVTLFWHEPYDQTAYPVISGVNIHAPLGDGVLPVREGTLVV